MPYQTILVHIDDSAHNGERLACAAALAQRHGAHLIVVAASGVSRALFSSMPPEADDPTLALHLGFVRAQASAALAGFEQQCLALPLPSFEARLIDDEAGAGISLHGRAADLIVLSHTHDDAARADIAPHVVLHAGRPVLLLPHAAHASLAGAQLGRRVLVSWDGSREAALALRLALPFLKTAEQIEIAVFATSDEVAIEARAADPLAYLARHGISAHTTLQSEAQLRTRQRRIDVGEALLSLAADKGADLLVMGAYGHSRVRETLLGGVTRTMFESMTIPVLMAH